MPERLVIDDVRLFPIQAFFNAVGDDSFVSVMDLLANGVGYSINECDCSFPGDLDPGEELFQGVRFSLFEQSVVITCQELRWYIEKVCKEFIDRHPADREDVVRILNQL